MKLKHLSTFLVVSSLLLTACAGTPTPDLEATVQAAIAATQAALPTATQIITPTDTPTAAATAIPTPIPPRFINHTPPELTVDFGPFEKAGCPYLEEYQVRKCNEDSPLLALGCWMIGETSDFLGALEPSYPIATCAMNRWGSAEEITHRYYSYSARGNCFYSVWLGQDVIFYQYVVFQDNQYKLIETEDEFRDIFAPIESADEALGYVVAVTGLDAKYGLEQDSRIGWLSRGRGEDAQVEYEYFVDVIEDTHVTTEPDGYLVHLFQTALTECFEQPHRYEEEVFAVDFRVTFAGHIEVTDRVKVLEHNLCVN